MKDDLDKLQADHASLKARLAQLEARVSEAKTGEKTREKTRAESATRTDAKSSVARAGQRKETEEVVSAETSELAPVRVERRGTVAIWTIDRPDRMNERSRARPSSLSSARRAKRWPTPACGPS